MPKRPPAYRLTPDAPKRQPRPSAAARGYGHRWRIASRQFLTDNPLCLHCNEAGRTTAAQCVDHREPHRGDAGKFWDRNNWQPLCHACHAIKTGQERAGSNP
jgi:5-methylcytosine-specific restriction protein A